MSRELELLERKISQLYSLRKQQKTLEDRLHTLSNQIKDEIVARSGHPLVVDVDGDPSTTIYKAGPSNLVAKVSAIPFKNFAGQGALDQLFDEYGLWDVYAERHVEKWALEEAVLDGEIPKEEAQKVLSTDYNLRLSIERKSDVQSEDERPS